MKSRPLVIAVAVLLFVVGCATQAAPPWSVAGKVVTTDNCVIGCPCILGEQPSHNTCRFVGVFQVEDGRFGDLDLAGTRFAMAGEFASVEKGEQQKYLYVAYYVDSSADSNQQVALRTILTGPSFAPLGKPAEVKALPITFEGIEKFGLVGATYGGNVGDIAKVRVTPVEGAKPGEPIVVENSAEPLFHWTALGKSSASYYRSGGKDYSFEGTSGESHRFAFSGGGEE